MTLMNEWREAVTREASGMPDGTRSTYLEWLGERQVILLERLVQDLTSGGEPDESEDEDGADPV